MNTAPPRPLLPSDCALYACTNRRARRARAAQHRSAQRVAHRQREAQARRRWPFEKKPVPPCALVVSGWTVGDLSLSEIGSKLREMASKLEYQSVRIDGVVQEFAKATNEILVGAPAADRHGVDERRVDRGCGGPPADGTGQDRAWRCHSGGVARGG